jgi:DNA repair ATPase RecN
VSSRPLCRWLISDVRELEIACQYDSVIQYQMVDIVTLVVPLISEASKEAIKLLTGKLLTESQIQSVSKHVVGKYFADLLPTSENEAEAEERISSARMHITEASNIISSLQGDLERQADQLEFLAKEIDQKKQIAERYAVLAQTNQDAFSAFKTEMEETLRKELNAQNEKGKTIRRTVSFASWLIALVAGAFLGAWFQIQLEPKVQSPKNQPTSQISR